MKAPSWIIIASVAMALPALPRGSGADEAIARHRMGEVVVKARRGAKVAVEQLRHEFWLTVAF